MWEAGEQALYDTGLQGLHPEIIKLLGRLSFARATARIRLYHAVETCHLSGILAAELGADVRTAKMGGLLHDLGKAVTHEVEGPHAIVGADIARRFGIPPKVVNIIAGHHHEVEQELLEAIIVESADAVQAPGPAPVARRWRLISSESRCSRILPTRSKAWSNPSQSRPAARFGSLSGPMSWTILAPSCCHGYRQEGGRHARVPGQHFEPRAPVALRQELRLKGVPEDIIAEVLGPLDSESSAYRAGTAYARRLSNLDQHTFRQKLGDHLLRRGFQHDVVWPVVDRLWREQRADTEGGESPDDDT